MCLRYQFDDRFDGDHSDFDKEKRFTYIHLHRIEKDDYCNGLSEYNGGYNVILVMIILKLK